MNFRDYADAKKWSEEHDDQTLDCQWLSSGGWQEGGKKWKI